jgi:tetratricopeptide (TPR) repeat protein
MNVIIGISSFIIVSCNLVFAVDQGNPAVNGQVITQMLDAASGVEKRDPNLQSQQNIPQQDQPVQIIEDNKGKTKEIIVDPNASEKYNRAKDSQSLNIMKRMQNLNQDSNQSSAPSTLGSVDDSISNVGFKDTSNIKISIKKININGVKIPKDKALNMAYDAFTIGDLESAAYYYKILLKEFPNDDNVMFQLAATYQLMMQDNDAVQLYMKIVEKDPSNYDAINNMSIIMSSRDPDMALRELNKIRIKNNQQHQIMAQLGTIKVAIGKIDEGIEDLFTANNLNPGNPYYIYNIAIGFDKKGDYKSAIQYYNICLQYFTDTTRIDKIFIVDRVKYLRNKSE